VTVLYFATLFNYEAIVESNQKQFIEETGLAAVLALINLEGTTLQLHSLRIIHYLATQGKQVTENLSRDKFVPNANYPDKNSTPVGKAAITPLLQLLASSNNEYVRAQVLQTLDYLLLNEENRNLAKKVLTTPVTGHAILQASRQLVSHPFARSLASILDDL